jgi:L-fuculose-phosphate aldolase
MEPEDVLLLEMDGSEVSPVPGRRPSSETPMHVEAYRQRPEMRAVIHAHPSYATALTVAGLDFPNDVLPEVLLGLGEVACAPYSTPSSEQDAEAIRLLIREHDAIMLCQHGSLTVGRNLEEALLKLERVESVAEVFWKAQLLGNVKRLPPEARQQLVMLREKFFKS